MVGQGTQDQDRDHAGREDDQEVDARDGQSARDAPPLEPVGDGVDQESHDRGHEQCDADPEQVMKDRHRHGEERRGHEETRQRGQQAE